MNPTDNKNLPSRLRESSFRRYELTIQAAVASFPNVIEISEKHAVATVNLVTFASRLRDAMASLAVYHWTSEKVDMDKFDEVYPKLKVSHVMPDRVVIGSAENIKSYYAEQNLPPSQFECFTPLASAKLSVTSAETPANATIGNTSIAVSLSQDTHDKGVELKLLAGLAALRLLLSPVEIAIDTEQASYLEENFDVVLIKVEDNKYIMQ